MRFAANAVRLQLHALAYTLATFLRTLATPEAIERRSLTALRERPIETGARLARHARSAVFQFAEAALPRAMFTGILSLIDALRGPPAQCPHDRNQTQIGSKQRWRGQSCDRRTLK